MTTSAQPAGQRAVQRLACGRPASRRAPGALLLVVLVGGVVLTPWLAWRIGPVPEDRHRAAAGVVADAAMTADDAETAPLGSRAPVPDLTTLAQEYVAAWNAHDVDGVLAFFAPDAIVRQGDTQVPDEVWNTQHDATALVDDAPRPAWAGYFFWARGSTAIRALLTKAFQSHPHVETANYQAAGDAITWRYRLREDPYQGVPGVQPLEGTAEMVVHDGRITRLSIVHDSDSLQRRWDAIVAAARRRAAQLDAAAGDPASAQDASSPHSRRTREGVEPTTLTWPLALGGLAVLGYLAGVLRRRAIRWERLR